MPVLYKNLTLAALFSLILLSGPRNANAQEGNMMRGEKILESLVFKSVKLELWHGNMNVIELAQNDLEPVKSEQKAAPALEHVEYPEELTKVLDKMVRLHRP